MRGLLSIVILCGWWYSTPDCKADPVQAHHARVELVSAQSDMVPGQQLLLGLHFSLERNWHIYWVNPGDSGQPPVLQWQLPAGVTAGGIEWPMPEKLTRSTLADYGYKDDVVLMVPIRSGSGLNRGAKAEIGLAAKWLICADVCIPDHAQFHLTLPISAGLESDGKQASLFNEAKKRLPKPWPALWRASAIAEKDDFVLSVRSGRPLTSVEFVPLFPDQIENAAPQPLEAQRTGAKLTLKKSDQLLKPVRVLKGLLVLASGKAYTIAAPVTAAPAKAHNE